MLGFIKLGRETNNALLIRLNASGTSFDGGFELAYALYGRSILVVNVPDLLRKLGKSYPLLHYFALQFVMPGFEFLQLRTLFLYSQSNPLPLLAGLHHLLRDRFLLFIAVLAL